MHPNWRGESILDSEAKLCSKDKYFVFSLSPVWVVGLDMFTQEHYTGCKTGIFRPNISRKAGITISGIGFRNRTQIKTIYELRSSGDLWESFI